MICAFRVLTRSIFNKEKESLKQQERRSVLPSAPLDALPSSSNPRLASADLQSASQPKSSPQIAGSGKKDPVSGITTVYRDINLDRPNLILFAILTGGDYEMSGFKGIGPKSAMRIIRAGLGERFWREADKRKTGEVDFTDWREGAACELENRATGSCLRSQAELMRAATTFPSLLVLNAYAQPEVSRCSQCGRTWSSPCQHRKVPDWNRPIDIARLVQFCSQHLEWHSSQIVDRFRNSLWPGLVMRSLRFERLEIDLIRWKKNNASQPPPPAFSFSNSFPLSTLLASCHGHSSSSTMKDANGLPSFRFSLKQDTFMSHLKPLLLSPDPRVLTAEQLHPTLPNEQGKIPNARVEYDLFLTEESPPLRHWFGETFTDVKASRDLIQTYKDELESKAEKELEKEEEREKKKAKKALDRERNAAIKAEKAEETKRKKEEKALSFKTKAKVPKVKSDAAGFPTSSDGPGIDSCFRATKRTLPAPSSLKLKSKKASAVVEAFSAVEIEGNHNWLKKYCESSDEDEEGSASASSSSIEIHENLVASPSTTRRLPAPKINAKKARTTSPLLKPPVAKMLKLSPVPSSPVGIASTSSFATRIPPAPRIKPTKSRPISSPPLSPAATVSSRSSPGSKQGLGTQDDPIVIDDSD